MHVNNKMHISNYHMSRAMIMPDIWDELRIRVWICVFFWVIIKLHNTWFLKYSRRGASSASRTCNSWPQGHESKPHIRCRAYLKKKYVYVYGIYTYTHTHTHTCTHAHTHSRRDLGYLIYAWHKYSLEARCFHLFWGFSLILLST